MREPVAEPAQARFLMLCAEGRYGEAESMLSIVYPNGTSATGDEVVARAAFYEDWGDAVLVHDPPLARTAYAQAEELFATVASWAPSGTKAEGEKASDAMTDVGRVQAKQAHHHA